MAKSKSEKQCVLVTGANGFLGTEIVRQAVAAGLLVRTTDRNEDPPVPHAVHHQADILDRNSLISVLSDVDTVIHAAGLAHVFDRSEAKSAFYAVNGQGTANVASAASIAGVRHFILISSVSVYGDGALGATEDTICRPVGPYAESKLHAEARAKEIARRDSMHLTILRLATLYGEGDPGNVARLMRAIDRNRFIWIGDGSNRKSLLYRGDAARACLIVLESGGDGIDIYNVSAPPVTMSEVIDGLASALNRRVPDWHIPASLAVNLSKIAANLTGRRGPFGTLELTLKKWLADDIYNADKFRDNFDFDTKIDLAEGLRREVSWYRRTQEV